MCVSIYVYGELFSTPKTDREKLSYRIVSVKGVCIRPTQSNCERKGRGTQVSDVTNSEERLLKSEWELDIDICVTSNLKKKGQRVT